MSSSPQPLLPVKAEWPSPSELTVYWSDGHVSSYNTGYLRDHCPCAWCKVERKKDPSQRDLLQQRPTEAALASPQVQVVGRYAARILWGDGHSTGIYSFDYLREICPCDQCQGKGEVAT